MYYEEDRQEDSYFMDLDEAKRAIRSTTAKARTGSYAIRVALQSLTGVLSLS